MTATEKDGLYLYAIVELLREIPTGMTGVDGQQVFAIPYRICLQLFMPARSRPIRVTIRQS